MRPPCSLSSCCGDISIHSEETCVLPAKVTGAVLAYWCPDSTTPTSFRLQSPSFSSTSLILILSLNYPDFSPQRGKGIWRRNSNFGSLVQLQHRSRARGKACRHWQLQQLLGNEACGGNRNLYLNCNHEKMSGPSEKRNLT